MTFLIFGFFLIFDFQISRFFSFQIWVSSFEFFAFSFLAFCFFNFEFFVFFFFVLVFSF